MELDDVFDEQQKPPAEVATQEGEAEQQEAEKAPAAEQGAPPAPDTTDKHVPLAALEAERRGRQDWKEKSIRAEERAKLIEEENRQLREQAQRLPPAEPLTEIQQVEHRAFQKHLNLSEYTARKQYGSEVVDKAFALFKVAAAANPALSAAVHDHPHPWDMVVQESKRLELLQEIGDDPVTYRQRIRDEVLAELNQSPAKPLAPLPQSLANARSSATRSAGGFTGPPPLSTLFEN